MRGIDGIVSCKVTVHVHQKSGDIDHFIERGASCLQNQADVFDDSLCLGGDVVIERSSFCILYGSTWNRIGIGLTRPLAMLILADRWWQRPW